MTETECPDGVAPPNHCFLVSHHVDTMIVPAQRHNFDVNHLNSPPPPHSISLMQRCYAVGQRSLLFFRRQSLSEKMEAELLVRWQDLTTFLTDTTRQKWWNNLMDAYRPRPFRGVDHLHQMLTFFDKYKDCLKDRYATAFAVFFKNIVYDPQSEDSATKSAQQLRHFAQETTFDSENYVADLIVASGSSSTDAHLTPGSFGGEDVHFVIDFDMAFLADPPKKFAEHELAQRKEYPNLSDEEYAKQRLKVLKLFLQVPNVYATKELREELEQRARTNIQHEIELLEKGERKY